MNEKDFDVWLQGHCAAFPEVPAAMNRSPNKVETKRHWLRLLTDTYLDDALVVTMRMLARREGYAEPLHTQLHQTPALVAQYAKKVYAERTAQQIERDAPAPKPAPPLKREEQLENQKLWQQVLREVAAGGDPHAITAKFYPADPEQERRYRCLVCEDTGLATVWAPSSMHLAREQTLTPERGCYSEVVRCWCRRGDAYEAMSLRDFSKGPTGQRTSPNIYNQKQFLTYRHRDETGKEFKGNTPEGVSRLVAFMATYIKNHGVQEIEY